jgi:hypothetical protein
MPDPTTARRGPSAARPIPSAASPSLKAPPSAKAGSPGKPAFAGKSAFPAKAGPSAAKADKAEHEILFQKYFKSVGPRTYAAQVKRATNGNHYLVLTEGKRDDATGEIRKTRLFIFGEDFLEFFRMLHETAQFIKANPVPDEVKKKRQRFWAKRADGGGGAKPPGPRRDFRPAPAAAPRNGTPQPQDAKARPAPAAPPAASRPRVKPDGQRGR